MEQQRLPQVVSLAGIVAPAGWLSLSLTPSHYGNDNDETAVVMAAAPSPANTATQALQLPPKKRKRSPSSSPGSSSAVHQETSARTTTTSHSLAIVVVPGSNSSAQSSASAAAAAALAPAMTAEEPIDAVPLRAAPPEPAWIRASLGLPASLPLHYITSKLVQASDLEPQQSRLLLHRGSVSGRLRPLLSGDELRAAGLDEPWARPKPAADGERKKTKGEKKQAGLLVPVFVSRAGFMIRAELTRWASNGNTVLKFRGEFRAFLRESEVERDDEMQIWAFRRDGVLQFVMSRTAAQKPPPAATNGGRQEETRRL